MSGSGTGVVAVDLGATSGRVIVGHASANDLRLETVRRFPNEPVTTVDGLHWNILELYRNVVEGLRSAARAHPDLGSVGVDSWAVDYALMRAGRMLATPYHYRDERTARGVARVHATMDPAQLYAANGLQFLPFNTVYQLASDDDLLELADSLLLIPDLITYWLTGRQVAEETNASTTGLLDVHDRTWDTTTMKALGIPTTVFPSLVVPGTPIGPVLVDLGTDRRELTCVAVGSHDTASAVVGVPMLRDDAAYISCGTWGLVGVELEWPVLTEESRLANFTNEAGVDGRVRYLHNVMGLWLLSESIRQWEKDGMPVDLPTLLDQAAAVTAPTPVFDANDERFLPPGDIPARITALCHERRLAAPGSRPEFVRSILESIAAAFAGALEDAARLSGRAIGIVHLVGGGSQNRLLCQLTADRSGLPVVAGPVEATAIGNVLIQARAIGSVTGDLENLRAVVAAAHDLVRFEPQISGARS